MRYFTHTTIITTSIIMTIIVEMIMMDARQVN